MQNLNTEQRTKVVEYYFSNGHSILLTQRAYRNYFNTKNAPSQTAINRLIKRFRKQGAVSDLPRSGRPRLAQNQVNIDRVRDSVEEDPETSTRRRSGQLGMSRTSLRRILSRHLHMHPYKVQLAQQLLPVDYHHRLIWATRFVMLYAENNEFLKNLIMSDEAHFHLNGNVNKQNMRFWGTANPRVVHQHQLHSLKCTVWCGVTSQRVIGPYFFENEVGKAVTVNGDRYRTMIHNFIRPVAANKWFQQDGATAHTARDTITLVNEIFDERIISRNSEFNWPARSPDLTAPDYFLWGYLKERVYVNKPQTIEQLKHNIEAEIRAIEPETLRAVMQNACLRAQLCIDENGGHLSDIIFHK